MTRRWLNNFFIAVLITAGLTGLLILFYDAMFKDIKIMPQLLETFCWSFGIKKKLDLNGLIVAYCLPIMMLICGLGLLIRKSIRPKPRSVIPIPKERLDLIN